MTTTSNVGSWGKLHESIAELTHEKEKNASKLMRKHDGKESNISSLEAEIVSTVAKLSLIET